jgi:hypothetical protein
VTSGRHRRCRATAFTALFASFLLAGCATERALVDPTLFPRSPAYASAPATLTIALVPDATLTEFKRVGDPWRDSGATLPTGRIIEAAAVAAIADVLGRAVARFPDAGSALASARFGPPVVLVTMRPVTQEIPVRGRGFAVRLTLDCRVLDANQTALWSRQYDSGAVGLSVEQLSDTNADAQLQELRAVHRAAYAVMVQVAEDLRRWIEAERLRERVL